MRELLRGVRARLARLFGRDQTEQLQPDPAGDAVQVQRPDQTLLPAQRPVSVARYRGKRRRRRQQARR